MRYMYLVTSDLNAVFVSETPPENNKELLQEARMWLKYEMDNIVTKRENVIHITSKEQIPNPWKKDAVLWGGRDCEEYRGDEFFDVIQEENAKKQDQGKQTREKERMQKIMELQREILKLLEEEEKES